METEEAQKYWANFPEAPYSDSFKVVDADGYEHLMTIRGWTGGSLLKSIEAAKKALAEGGYVPAGKPRAQTTQEPERVAVGANGDPLPPIKSFVAEKLSVSFSDGKYYYKVIGGNFTKYGVTVWPEPLIAAGLGVNDDGTPAWGNPPNPPSIQGWKAEYIEFEKNGKKQMKVTRLLKP